MKNRSGWCVSLLMLVLCFVCLVPSTVRAAASTKAPQASPSRPSFAGGKQWDSLVTAAKKEGTVSVYAMWIPETRIALTRAFKEKYGIDVEFTPFNRGSEIMTKMETEQRAGLYLADLVGAGAGSFLTVLKPAGIIGPVDKLLVLPEVTDGKYWRVGKFPFLDKDKTTIGMVASVQRNIIYNTNLVKKGEITTYKDLLKPQYKGKITINDPTIAGSGKEVFLHLALNIWNLDETKVFLKQLLKQQEAVIERDNRQNVESVARGKYAIGLGPNPDTFAEFLKQGTPLDAVLLKEGVFVSSAAGCIAVPSKFAHPNAAKLFVNWLLSKEGQTVFVKTFGNPSMRNDVSTSQFNPIFLTQPNEKVFLANETSILFTDEISKATKQIIDEVYK